MSVECMIIWGNYQVSIMFTKMSDFKLPFTSIEWRQTLSKDAWVSPKIVLRKNNLKKCVHLSGANVKVDFKPTGTNYFETGSILWITTCK